MPFQRSLYTTISVTQQCSSMSQHVHRNTRCAVSAEHRISFCRNLLQINHYLVHHYSTDQKYATSIMTTD